MKQLPLIGELADGRGRQVDQQLRKIELRINYIPAASTGQVGEDGSGASSSAITDEEAVFPI